MIDIAQKPLSGKKGLVLGIANEHSLAYGCAKAFRAFGAELAITYSSNKAKPYVEPLARELDAPIFLIHYGQQSSSTGLARRSAAMPNGTLSSPHGSRTCGRRAPNVVVS